MGAGGSRPGGGVQGLHRRPLRGRRSKGSAERPRAVGGHVRPALGMASWGAVELRAADPAGPTSELQGGEQPPGSRGPMVRGPRPSRRGRRRRPVRERLQFGQPGGRDQGRDRLLGGYGALSRSFARARPSFRAARQPSWCSHLCVGESSPMTLRRKRGMLLPRADPVEFLCHVQRGPGRCG